MNASIVKRHFTLDMDESQVNFLKGILDAVKPSSNLAFAETLARFKERINEFHDVSNKVLELDDEELQIKRFEIDVCNQCLNLEGAMCHNPHCMFCRQITPDIKNTLNICQIRIDLNRHDDSGEENLHIADGYPLSMRGSV